MSETFFIIGLATGALLGAAVAILFAERRVEKEVADWESLLADQQGHIAELRAMPRAVTKLTSRTKTVEIE
jgi:gas vesicle protein